MHVLFKRHKHKMNKVHKHTINGRRKYTGGSFGTPLISNHHRMNGIRPIMSGGNFFSDIGNSFVNTIKKPSTILGLASMLPTPLSGPLKAASVVSGLTGHGKRKRVTVGRSIMTIGAGSKSSKKHRISSILKGGSIKVV